MQITRLLKSLWNSTSSNSKYHDPSNLSTRKGSAQCDCIDSNAYATSSRDMQAMKGIKWLYSLLKDKCMDESKNNIIKFKDGRNPMIHYFLELEVHMDKTKDNIMISGQSCVKFTKDATLCEANKKVYQAQFSQVNLS